MPDRTHMYSAHLAWEGNTGSGTATVAGYSRQYRIRVDGKPDLLGSATPVFKGDPALYDPESLFLAAISACHMLSYLALAARKGVTVVAYEDDARGTLVIERNGRFSEVILSPRVVVAEEDQIALARELHETAHEQCFIANSCSVPIRHQATVIVGGAGTPGAGDV